MLPVSDEDDYVPTFRNCSFILLCGHRPENTKIKTLYRIYGINKLLEYISSIKLESCGCLSITFYEFLKT